jgi:hypothetical protein
MDLFGLVRFVLQNTIMVEAVFWVSLVTILSDLGYRQQLHDSICIIHSTQPYITSTTTAENEVPRIKKPSKTPMSQEAAMEAQRPQTPTANPAAAITRAISTAPRGLAALRGGGGNSVTQGGTLGSVGGGVTTGSWEGFPEESSLGPGGCVGDGSLPSGGGYDGFIVELGIVESGVVYAMSFVKMSVSVGMAGTPMELKIS